jgi:hypothetical protein
MMVLFLFFLLHPSNAVGLALGAGSFDQGRFGIEGLLELVPAS